jgi:hypothetical protein
MIAYVLNGPRVVALVLFPDSSFWSGHTTQGVLVCAVGALCIALLDYLIEPRQRAAAPAAPAAAWPGRPPRGAFAWLAAAALASLLVPRYAMPPPNARGELLPEAPPPWHTERTFAVDDLFLGSVRFFRSDQRAYAADPAPLGTVGTARGIARADAFVGEDLRRNRSASLLSEKHRVAGRGWLLDEARAETLAGGMRGERVVARREARRVLSWVWYAGVESVAVETFRAFFALDQSPFARPGPAYVVRLSTELGNGDAEKDRAERRLRLLARSLGDSLPRPPRAH